MRVGELAEARVDLETAYCVSGLGVSPAYMHSIGCGEEGYGRTGPCICSQLNFTESTLGL